MHACASRGVYSHESADKAPQEAFIHMKVLIKN